MQVADYVAQVRAESALLVDAALAAGFDSAVPTCPEWAVRDLLAHVGEAHRWATRVLRGEQHGFPAEWPRPSDDELADWVRAGAAEVVEQLLAAPAGSQCWTFWPVDDAVLFWARRMANETAIHRVDAQRVRGASTAVDADLAAGGIEELIAGMLAMRPKGVRTEVPVRVAVVVDGGPSWLVTLSAERVVTEPGVGPADLTVSGSASDLFTWVWNRGGDVRLEGDEAAAQLWQRLRVRLV